MEENKVDIQEKNRKRFNNVLGVSIFAVLLTIISCIVFYIFYDKDSNFKSILPVASEKYKFENTEVIEGKIEPVKDVSKVVDSTMPSVVAITEMKILNSYDSFFNYNFGYGQDNNVSSGSGSGIIIEEDDTYYYIATNNHVVDGADKIEITFIDKKSVEASIKGKDASNDLAILTVAKKSLKDSTKKAIKVATIGDSDSLRVGENVIAIGNALGYGQSVTLGYVSAKERKVELESGTMKAIQTDAAINPGNSGGALLNSKGEVIGISSAKLAAAEVEGMGYAIPISNAQPILDKLIKKKTVKKEDKGYIGITGRTVRDDEKEILSYPEGVFVVSVMDNGGAKKAGIKEGDIITKVNGEKVTTIDGLITELENYSKGEKVKVEIERIDKGEFSDSTLEVELTAEIKEQEKQEQFD